MADTSLPDKLSLPLRKIQSFVRREGRLTLSQEKALQMFWPHYGIEADGNLMDFGQVFQNTHPVILEIGFGMGGSLLAMAKTNPDKNYLGMEVHRPGVGTLLREVHAKGLSNIRVMAADAVMILKTQIQDYSLAGLQLFFPDPWPKKKHHKRRIVQPEFVQLLRQKLCPGGFFHLATDWQPYAEHMMAVLSAAEGFKNRFGEGCYAPDRCGRPETKFEQRGQRLGHGVWDLLFETLA